MTTTRHTRPARGAFTLVEMLVVISIIGILMSLLLPAVGAVRASGRSTVCKSNLHQFGMAYKNHYSDGNERNRVDASLWTKQFMAQAQDVSQMFRCPDGAAASSETPTPRIELWRDSDPVKSINLAQGQPLTSWVTLGPGHYQVSLDSGYSVDLDDLVIDIQENSDGSVSGKVLSTDGSHRCVFFDSDSTKILEVARGGKGGDTFTFHGIPSAHYGMNVRAWKMTDSESKILILDYDHTVANVSGPNSEPSEWAKYGAARHSGSSNILFTDSRVESRLIEEIDPRDAELHDKFWRPDNDPYRFSSLKVQECGPDSSEVTRG